MKSAPHAVISWGGFVLVGVLGFAAGIQPLTDPDIGWHLIGGLSMLSSGAVPWRDPIGVEGARWISYSWLFEIVLGYLYVAGGFLLVHLSQVVLIVSSAVVLLLILRAGEGTPKSSWNGVVEIFSIGFALLCFAPFWHLRPQVVSVVLFALLVLSGEKKRLSLPVAAITTALWASIHVFWVFGPLLYGLYRAYGGTRSVRDLGWAAGGALLVTGAAAISPYGAHNFEPPFLYLFDHKTAYRFIVEFQSLVEVRVLLIITLAHAIWIAAGGREMVRRAGLPLYILYIVFLAAALIQRKYLPFVGVAGMFLSARRLGGSSGEFPAARECARGAGTILLGALAALPLRTASVAPKWEELLRLGPVLTERAQGRTTVLNHFNDGGWLGLALYLVRPPSAAESEVKCWIDGRTLVAGGTRLDVFATLLEDNERQCRSMRRLDYRFALFPRPRGSRSSPLERCGIPSREIFRGDSWIVSERLGHAAP